MKSEKPRYLAVVPSTSQMNAETEVAPFCWTMLFSEIVSRMIPATIPEAVFCENAGSRTRARTIAQVRESTNAVGVRDYSAE